MDHVLDNSEMIAEMERQGFDIPSAQPIDSMSGFAYAVAIHTGVLLGTAERPDGTFEVNLACIPCNKRTGAVYGEGSKMSREEMLADGIARNLVNFFGWQACPHVLAYAAIISASGGAIPQFLRLPLMARIEALREWGWQLAALGRVDRA